MPARTIIVTLFVLLSMESCNKPDGKLVAIQSLPGYPSGSGIIFLNGLFYIVGDDAPYVLVTDSSFNTVDSIPIFELADKRMPKDRKPDMEAIAVVNYKKEPWLLLVGSGSVSPYRDSSILINPVTKEIKRFNLDFFYERLKSAGINDLNIEGISTLQTGLVLASRGNLGFPQNNLIITSDGFWENQGTANLKLIKVGANKDSSVFQGVSGLDYSHQSDQLLLTVSTETTANSYEDGPIGKSYLWIINNITSKKEYEGINPDRVIDLEKMDPRFKGHKIESVCIVAERDTRKELALIADDDKGGTVLFRILL